MTVMLAAGDDGFATLMALFLCTLLLPTLCLIGHILDRQATRREIEDAKEFCVACGYDLRGKRHDRCPECGRVMTYDA